MHLKPHTPLPLYSKNISSRACVSDLLQRFLDGAD